MSSILIAKILIGTVVGASVINAVVNTWRFGLSMVDRANRKSRTKTS